MDNVATTDDRLSLKSFGLLVKLLSMPDSWEFSESGLDSIFKKDGLTSIKSGLKELEYAGYLIRRQSRDKNGRICGVEWTVSERPMCQLPTSDLPTSDLPTSGFPTSVNHIQLNTNTIKDLKIKDLKNKESLKESQTLGQRTDYESFFSVYNSTCTNLPKCKAETEGRKKAIKKFLKDLTFEDWQNVCKKANQIDFLIGNNKNHWKANIDFLLRPDKAAGVLEDYYGGGKQGKNYEVSENDIFAGTEWE